MSKIIEIEITKEMCKELNSMQDRIFSELTQEQKDILGIKRHYPCKLRCLHG